jgi:hypothetical protein
VETVVVLAATVVVLAVAVVVEVAGGWVVVDSATLVDVLAVVTAVGDEALPPGASVVVTTESADAPADVFATAADPPSSERVNA